MKPDSASLKRLLRARLEQAGVCPDRVTSVLRFFQPFFAIAATGRWPLAAPTAELLRRTSRAVATAWWASEAMRVWPRPTFPLIDRPPFRNTAAAASLRMKRLNVRVDVSTLSLCREAATNGNSYFRDVAPNLARQVVDTTNLAFGSVALEYRNRVLRANWSLTEVKSVALDEVVFREWLRPLAQALESSLMGASFCWPSSLPRKDISVDTMDDGAFGEQLRPLVQEIKSTLVRLAIRCPPPLPKQKESLAELVEFNALALLVAYLDCIVIDPDYALVLAPAVYLLPRVVPLGHLSDGQGWLVGFGPTVIK
ncbi:MAG: hypothetical protein PHT12_05550 [Patescibacteria group bacterium]|nr:hypothetical protein [Patescibacteria group bacterium]